MVLPGFDLGADVFQRVGLAGAGNLSVALEQWWTHIDFDQLAGVPIPNGTLINNQWLQYAGVKFYSNNGFFPVHIYQTCGPCSTTSPPNYINTKPDDAGVLNVEFTQSVSNLSFFIVGVDAFFNNPFAVLDVYRGGSFYASYVLEGNSSARPGARRLEFLA